MSEELLSWFNVFDRENAWIIQVFIVVFITLVVSFFAKHLFNQLEKQLMKTKNAWDDALLHAVRKPLHCLVWLFGLSFAITIIEKTSQAVIFEAVEPIRDLGVIVILGWTLVRFVRNVEDNLIAGNGRKPVDATTAHAVGKLLRVSVVITTALVALQTLGYSVSGVLAFGGIGGLAIGLASKDLLANFFGGLMIYLDRPFVMGDWIRSPDRQIEGTVEEIGWRLTRIRTFDKRALYVPNSIFANITVENPSRMTNRRIYETIGIRYDDIGKMDLVVEDVKAMLREHEEIDQAQTMIVNFNKFSDSSVDFFVYTFTKTTQWVRFHEIKHDVLLKISEIITRHGAEIAYPTQTIHTPGLTTSN